MLNDLLTLFRRSRIYDLAQPYYPGMPHHPNHPPYLFGLTKKHGDYLTPGGVSSAADAVALGSHVGTHIDALCHFSCRGKLHTGEDVMGVQSYASGLERLTIDTVAPIFRRGVLLDIAALAGTDILPVDFSVTPQHLDDACARQNVSIESGDVVLLRTGWARYWDDAATYIRQAHGPGPEGEGARWLSSRSIHSAGSDTVAFERIPAAEMPVHTHLLVEKGIHIIEALNLEEIARERIYEFAFIAAPLKIKGATGSPIRALALVP
jgi:kynurenine formamidase